MKKRRLIEITTFRRRTTIVYRARSDPESGEDHIEGSDTPHGGSTDLERPNPVMLNEGSGETRRGFAGMYSKLSSFCLCLKESISSRRAK